MQVEKSVTLGCNIKTSRMLSRMLSHMLSRHVASSRYRCVPQIASPETHFSKSIANCFFSKTMLKSLHPCIVVYLKSPRRKLIFQNQLQIASFQKQCWNRDIHVSLCTSNRLAGGAKKFYCWNCFICIFRNIVVYLKLGSRENKKKLRRKTWSNQILSRKTCTNIILMTFFFCEDYRITGLLDLSLCT